MRRLICIPVMILGLAVSAFADEQKIETAPAFVADQLEGEKGPYLIGPITRESWLEFDPGLKDVADSYAPSPDLVKALSYYPDDIEITCVLGTWCSDSHREVPRFWTLLDRADMPGTTFTMLAVGRTDAPEALVWEADRGVVPGYRDLFDIELVPTFVVSKGGHEIGRIVETPEISLEADLAAILGLRAEPAWH